MTSINEKGESVNPKMGALFYTQKEETPKPVTATIKGEIPPWINGCLLRNGPGKYELGEQQMNHLFDGLSLLHRFNIQNGKVTYQNQFLKSDAYVLGMEKNRLVLSEFGTLAYPDPCLNIFQRFMARFMPMESTDNCCVNWFQVEEEFYVCSETNLIRKVDPDTLTTLNKVDISKTLALHRATAHPHTHRDGTMYNMGSTYQRRPTHSVVKMPPPNPGVKGDPYQNASILASIPTSVHETHPSYFHSFGMTDNYIVFLEQPLIVNVYKILWATITNQPLTNALEYHPEWKAKFHLIQRDNGEIIPIKYEADAFFCFHHINAYEENGHIVVDMVCYQDACVLEGSYLKPLREGILAAHKSTARRYVLPIEVKQKQLQTNLNTLDYSKAKSVLKSNDTDTVHCSYELICDQALELPRINYEAHNGKPYRYFYGTSGKDGEELVKSDARTCSSIQWHEDGCFPGEPVFVGRPGATDEDDGVILSGVVDLNEGHHPFLLVLDAKTFEEIGRAEIPVEMAIGTHGIFVARN